MIIDNKGIEQASQILNNTSMQLSMLFGRPVIATFEFTDVQLVNQNKIIQSVTEVTQVSFSELVSRTRTNRISFARYHCFQLMKKYMDSTSVYIGKVFDKDHSTVITGLETFKNMYKLDREFREEHDAIEQKLLGNESDIETNQ